MWTTLGLLLFVLACAVAWFVLGHRRWHGQARAGFEVIPRTNKGSLMGLELGVRTRTALEFELKREGWLDRAAKAIGLSVEAQLGRPRIDEALYLVADEPRVASALRADRDLVDALHALFTPIAPEVSGVQRVVCRGGVLVLKLATRAKADQADRLATIAAPALIAVADRLAGAHAGTPPPDRLWWRATAVLAIASGLLAHGLLDAFRLVFDYDRNTLELAKLWWLTLPVATGVLLALATLAIGLLGRTSRAHFVLVQAMLLAILGVPLGAMAELRDYNMEADTAAAQTFEARVTGKRVSKSNKGGRTYEVELASWPGQPEGYELTVRPDDFDRYLYGSTATVVVREGRLGVRWIESVTPAGL